MEQGFFSLRDRSIARLRAIIEDDEKAYSTPELISAIKELRILMGDDGDRGRGPGTMSQPEITSELHRLRALTGG